MDISKLRKGDVVLVRMTAQTDYYEGVGSLKCTQGAGTVDYGSTLYVYPEHIVSVEAKHFNPREIVDMGGKTFTVIAQDGPCLFVRDGNGEHNVLKANDVRLLEAGDHNIEVPGSN